MRSFYVKKREKFSHYILSQHSLSPSFWNASFLAPVLSSPPLPKGPFFLCLSIRPANSHNGFLKVWIGAANTSSNKSQYTWIKEEKLEYVIEYVEYANNTFSKFRSSVFRGRQYNKALWYEHFSQKKAKSWWKTGNT